MFQHPQNRLFRADAKLWPTMVAWQFAEAATAAASAVVAQKQQQVTELYNALKQNRDKLATPDQQILDEYESKIGAINKTSAKELADLHSTLEELAKVARIEVKSAPRPVTREATTKLIDDLVSLTDEEKAKLTTDDGKQIAAVQAAFAAWEDRGNNADQSGLATIHQQAQQLQTRLWKMLSKQQAATQEATKPAPKPAEVAPEQWSTFADQLKAYILAMKANNLDHATNKAAIEEFEKRLQNITKIEAPANEAELRRLHADLVIFAEGAKQDMTTLPKLPEAGKPAAEKNEKPADPNKRYIKVRTTLNVRDKDGKVDSTLPPNAEITIDPTQTKKGLHPTDKSIEYVRVTLGVTGASAKELYVAKGDGKKSFLSDTPITPEKPDGAKPRGKPIQKVVPEKEPIPQEIKDADGYKELIWIADNLAGTGTKGTQFEAVKKDDSKSLDKDNVEKVNLHIDLGGGKTCVAETAVDGGIVGFWQEQGGNVVKILATSGKDDLYVIPPFMAHFAKGTVIEQETDATPKTSRRNALFVQWSIGQKLGIKMGAFSYDVNATDTQLLNFTYRGATPQVNVLTDGKITVSNSSTLINMDPTDATFQRIKDELDAAATAAPPAVVPPAGGETPEVAEMRKKMGTIGNALQAKGLIQKSAITEEGLFVWSTNRGAKFKLWPDGSKIGIGTEGNKFDNGLASFDPGTKLHETFIYAVDSGQVDINGLGNLQGLESWLRKAPIAYDDGKAYPAESIWYNYDATGQTYSLMANVRAKKYGVFADVARRGTYELYRLKVDNSVEGAALYNGTDQGALMQALSQNASQKN